MRKISSAKLLVAAALTVAILAGLGSWTWVSSQAADDGESLKVQAYSNAIRFTLENNQVSLVRAEIFDLGGRQLFDSGPRPGNALDWPKTTASGERVAHGVYLYVIQAWDGQGQLVESRVGKLALVPGAAGVGQAPPLISGDEREGSKSESESKDVEAQIAYNEDVVINGNNGLVFDEGSVTTMTIFSRHEGGVSDRQVLQASPEANDRASFQFYGGRTWADGAFFEVYGDDVTGREGAVKVSAGSRSQPNTNNTKIYFQIQTNTPSTINAMAIDKDGKVGIGTTSPAATLEVHGSQPNLLALYDPAQPSSAKFKVQKDGDVYADGSYNCGMSSGCFNSGQGADVAERIDVTEAVEAGDVVEIDPQHPGKFRKARAAMSRRVAGVISTAPAITLGNNFLSEHDQWQDNRPLLALAGRVPVKATAKYGEIRVGDLLVSSPIPGYAQVCHQGCVGAVIGKALEPLAKGTGKIEVQVTLR